MDTLRAAYKDDDDDDNNGKKSDNGIPDPPQTETLNGIKEEPLASEDLSDDEISDGNNHKSQAFEKEPKSSPKLVNIPDDVDDDDEEDPPPKKQKQLSSLAPTEDEAVAPTLTPPIRTTNAKKGKKKGNNVWTKSTSRKGKKKIKNSNNNNNNNNNNSPNNAQAEDKVFITPIPRFLDKNDDTQDSKIRLSKLYKAEKVELSDDRLTASSSKGYRMVRTTRGVMEGAWYFEIKVVNLGETGHTRLGWSTEKGDLQAPVGYDANSFGYRDIDGSKIHKATRDKYGDEGYGEGDVIGFYINLPEGNLYKPEPPRMVFYKGQRYVCAPDAKEDPPKVVPGSEISFFKNGRCQGVAFKDLYGGRYYPAASMYTLPNQPNCVVKFNFGPDFEFFPEDFGDRPVPSPMLEVPYHGFDSRVFANGNPWVSTRMCPTLKLVKEQDTKFVDADGNEQLSLRKMRRPFLAMVPSSSAGILGDVKKEEVICKIEGY